MANKNSLWLVEFPGIWLGGTCVVKCATAKQARHIAASTNLGLDVDWDSDSIKVSHIPATADIIFNDNGDY